MEIPDLVPVDNYDARQARLESGLRWLLSKAYGGSVPSDYQEPFFSSGLSLVLASRLTSSELYWAAAGAIFPEVKGQEQQGHTPLIQLLTRRGIYLSDVNGTEVNEELLQSTSPVHLMAHITLLEGLMTAYINNTLTPENVVPAVRKFATFLASNELPSSAEDAALFWVNKVCAALCCHLRELNPSVCPKALTMNDVRDVSDGRCLVATVSFYCPQELPISAIELGDSLAIADSLHNLQLTYNFCRSHLNAGLLTLKVTDLFYGQEALRLNVLSFLADLFRCFEVEKASCVRDTGQPFTFEKTNAPETRLQRSQALTQPSLQPTLQQSLQQSQVVIPQISDPTKQSFLQSVSTKQSRPQSSTANGARQSLLPRRQSDVSSSNNHQPPIEAWVSNGVIPDPSGKATNDVNASSGDGLLPDSSIQSSDNEVRSEPNELSKDVDRKRTVEPPSSLGPLQTCVVRSEASNTASHSSEPLLPAKLRPSKEKSNNHSKKCEYSEKGGRKKHKALKSDGSACVRSEPKRESSDDGSSTSTPLDGYNAPSLDSIENNAKETAFEGRDFICLNSNIDPEFDSRQLSRGRPGGQNCMAEGRVELADGVLAQGLSAVGLERSLANPGCGSSNDGSDQELHKLRADSRDKECAGRNNGRRFFVSLGRDSLRQHGGPNGSLDKGIGLDGRRDAKTSFSQIKQQKEAEKISKGLRDIGSETEGILADRPKGVSLLARPRKNAGFNSPQNQTTWVQESAQRISDKKATSSHNEDPAELLPSELIGLRLKLEENRRQIENRKKLAEKQWYRQRQQMGKEAFIQVIAKSKSGAGDVSGDERSSSSNAGSMESVGHIVPVTSDVGNTEAYTLPKSQNPDLMAIQEPENSNADRAGNRSDCTERANVKILAEVKVDPISSSSPVAGKALIDETIDSRQGVADAATHGGLHSSADTEVQVSYDSSLDRINSSLTELQGVIQRLSRQQDQINSMVGLEVGQNVATASPQDLQGLEEYQQSMHGTSSAMGKDDDVLVQQFPMARETLLPGAGANPLPVGVHNFLYGEKQQHQSSPSASPYSVSSYQTMGTPFPQRFHSTPSAPLSISSYQQPYAGVPPVSVPAERMYLPAEVGHQFLALGSQFHPSPVIHSMVPGMYPMSVPTSYGHYPGPVPHQQYQNLLTLVQRTEFPAGMAFPEFLPHPSSFSSQVLPPADPLSFVPSAATLGPRQDQERTHSLSSPSEPLHLGRPLALNQAASFISGQAPGTNEPSDARGIVENVQPLPSQGLGDAGQAGVPPQSGGFFVNLGDPSTPLRQKPTLKTRVRAKSKSGGDDSLSSESTSAASMSPTATELLPSPDSQSTAAVISGEPELPGNAETSPLVFVIGQSAENEDDWLEMERRKQRLCELQVKRQEEQEQRRERLLREQELKREEQRLKQESSDLKRAEEKARREAIYQTYLQKKREKEMSEESPSKPVPPVIRRQRNALQRSARPRSQPAIMAEMAATGGAPGMVGRGSHDSLMMEGVASKTTMSTNSQSDEKMNSLRGDVPLAFGGLTHRRPATPDPNSQAVQTTSDGSESSGSQVADNYTGPKLFVKPSQKSNRHIITNAIGHCCLAGSVNRDIKDKVLEEIAKSDAKHFIILFRDAAMQYRGLYTYNPEQEEVMRIHGVGPKQLTDKVMEKFYKYNSGSKKFSEVTSTKHLSATIDAITVLSTVWQKARSAAPAKKPL